MNAPLPTLSRPGLELSSHATAAGLDVSFDGTADMHAIEELDGYLAAVHAAAIEQRAERVRVDFRRLEFMNSSCFKSFVTWIGQVQETTPRERYRIAFRSNPQMHWQRRSLNALRCFALDLITIET